MLPLLPLVARVEELAGFTAHMPLTLTALGDFTGPGEGGGFPNHTTGTAQILTMDAGLAGFTAVGFDGFSIIHSVSPLIQFGLVLRAVFPEGFGGAVQMDQ